MEADGREESWQEWLQRTAGSLDAEVKKGAVADWVVEQRRKKWRWAVMSREGGMGAGHPECCTGSHMGENAGGVGRQRGGRMSSKTFSRHAARGGRTVQKTGMHGGDLNRVSRRMCD